MLIHLRGRATVSEPSGFSGARRLARSRLANCRVMRRLTRGECSLCISEVCSLKQNLVHSVLFLHQPLEGFVREQVGDERINDLQCEYE